MKRRMDKYDQMLVGLVFKIEFCDMCGWHVVCPKCGNNCCNGGYGQIDGKDCDICPIAHGAQEGIGRRLYPNNREDDV